MTDSVPNRSEHAAASSGTPLDAVVFEKLMAEFAPFEAAPVVGVAVSGGADSMALALLTHEWCQARGGAILAITVDHGLRADSAQEAQWVGDQLSEHGIEHVILRWQGTKPSRAVQEQARRARYDLMDQLLADRGILHLLVAHHAGDQAETIAMREMRGPTPLGQAGMSARRFMKHARVLRPFLAVNKADLVATLQSRHQAWVEDPSNRNEKFERVRVRNQLADDPGPSRHRADIARERRTLEQSIGRLLAGFVTLHGNGVALCARSLFMTGHHDDTARIYAVGQVVRTVGGAGYMPAFDSLAGALARISENPSARLSLGGCVLHARRDQVCVYRERGRLDGAAVHQAVTMDVSADVKTGSVCWDNRFELLLNRADFGGLIDPWIGPLDLCDVFHTKAFRAALREIVPFIGNLPRAALASMPALYDKEGLRSVGGLEVSELSDVLSAADCEPPSGRGKFAFGGRWRFAPPVPLWESGFKSSPKPDNLLA
ncbi:tRNA lysidine(34) synthetase TilS [uncultured Thalassospira sp.]|uniref:tRNA lysidine(34) synthetase TilS n=1 Tax=uncultured Thalassospira sp. TaxID=404382 RepID=UPI00259A5D61|nr:tRNA lysidine(34) synthetase TilS [uncultured Thalassospira sp.]